MGTSGLEETDQMRLLTCWGGWLKGKCSWIAQLDFLGLCGCLPQPHWKGSADMSHKTNCRRKDKQGPSCHVCMGWGWREWRLLWACELFLLKKFYVWLPQPIYRVSIINIFGIIGLNSACYTTQLCHCSGKAAIDNSSMNEWTRVLIKLYLQSQAAVRFGLREVVCWPLTYNEVPYPCSERIG